jgi:carbamoyltransferase
MNILSINFNHDGSAVVLRDGDIAGYVNTERFSRLKKHPGIRQSELEEVLDQAGISIKNIDQVELVNLNTMDSEEIPKLYGSYLKETWPDLWVDVSCQRLRFMGYTFPANLPNEHHLFHAALAYYYSPFDTAVSLSCDPVGACAYFFRNGKVLAAQHERLVSPNVYAMLAARLFGTSLIGAGKLMALAPYGSSDTAKIDYRSLTGMTPKLACRALVAATERDAVFVSAGSGSLNASLAYHAQRFLEFEVQSVLERLSDACGKFGVDLNLCLSGGTALNSVANQRCYERSRFQHLYLHPACGDDGTAIGAALYRWHQILGQPKRKRSNRTAMYSCRDYNQRVGPAIHKYRDRIYIDETAEYLRRTASLIADGRVVGWFQGPSEIGPRALGNRSILADPRGAAVKDYLNRVIKQRELFRPFAPAVLKECADEWFGISDSPFMLRVGNVCKSGLPAITHIDGSARVQTVTREDKPNFYRLISFFYEISRTPVLLNTSFNGKSEPIVETPDDAIECLLRTKLDALIFPGVVLQRRD